jgi:rSAM/selenodomain-associated transferase 2
MPRDISVVIPTLDEEAQVAAAVCSVRDHAEVIVVDGGSADRTREVAAAEGAKVLRSARGRGCQLDTGARQAQGEWIVLLHADTRLDDGWAAALRGLPVAVVGGAFRFAVDSPRAAYRVLERGVALRCRVLRMPYGDQGIFVRRETYEQVGGVPHLPLMEDVTFMRRLGRAGRLAFPPVQALTSARRWERQGIVATTLKNWSLVALYVLGVSPERLARAYEGQPPPPPETRPAEKEEALS